MVTLTSGRKKVDVDALLQLKKGVRLYKIKRASTSKCQVAIDTWGASNAESVLQMITTVLVSSIDSNRRDTAIRVKYLKDGSAKAVLKRLLDI